MSPVVGIAAWVATYACIGGYGWMVRTNRPFPYHVINAVAAVVLGVFNASLGAWQAVQLNAFYGVIAAWAVTRAFADRRLSRT